MIIYSSPNSGKTIFCNQTERYVDGDTILFGLFKEYFKVDIIDDHNKGQQILNLFQINKLKAEKCYTKYMEWLKFHKYTDAFDILIGTRRFMWLADLIFIKKHLNHYITDKEIESIRKWNLQYTLMKDDEFINVKLILKYHVPNYQTKTT